MLLPCAVNWSHMLLTHKAPGYTAGTDQKQAQK